MPPSKDAHGQAINAGYGVSPYLDPSTFIIDFVAAQSLAEEHLNGQPWATFNLTSISCLSRKDVQSEQSIEANSIEILLDCVVITPSCTNAYHCYIPPTEADWMIGQHTNLRVDPQVASLGNDALLFDKSLGDGSKGGVHGWTPPLQNGRCVMIGVPVGMTEEEAYGQFIQALKYVHPGSWTFEVPLDSNIN